MDEELFAAILAMDSYNRGYGAGLVLDQDVPLTAPQKLGSATIIPTSPENQDGWRGAGFFASQYLLANGQKVISFRGTNTDSFLGGTWPDIINGWAAGGGEVVAQQEVLAETFFNTVRGQDDPRSSNILLTGHSLGAGLAGLIGELNGLPAYLFDNMPFDVAALNTQAIAGLGNQEIRDRIYDRGAPWNLDRSKVKGYYTQGEVLAALRAGVSAITVVDDFQPTELSTYGASVGGAVDLHSVGMLVMLMFGRNVWEAQNGTYWRDGAQYLLPALFNETLANAVGFGALQGVSVASAKLQQAIAYSAITDGQERDRPFGDTAIFSLFDDSDDIGRAAKEALSLAESASAQLSAALGYIGDASIEFAGRLAINKVLASANATARKGILRIGEDASTLSVDFSAATWAVNTSDSTYVSKFKKDIIESAVDKSVGQGEFIDALRQYYLKTNHVANDDPYDAIKSVSFETVTQPNKIDISTVPPGLNLLFLKDGNNGANASGSGADRMIAGTSGSDKITGGDELDVIMGGAGKDVIDGGGGDDIIYGGADQDTIHVDGNNSGADTVQGGSGADRIFVSDQDTIDYPDAGDQIFFDNIRLTGATRRSDGSSGNGLSGQYYDSYHNITYDYDAAAKTLTVYSGSVRLTLHDFDNGEAGINLKSTKVSPPRDPQDVNKPPLATDPLVLDLDGDGIELTDANSQRVYFDLTGDGLADRVGWVSADDGLLARDLNGDGRITGLNELFGTSSVDGFTVLVDYDSNHDGIINASDDIWSTLRIWRDADVDGDTDLGELKPLSYYGITSISLDAHPVDHNSSNNLLAFSSSYQLANGTTREIAAAYMQTRQVDATEAGDADYPDGVYEIPDLAVPGLTKSLHAAAATDPTLLGIVQDLVADARTLNAQQFRQAFVAVLMRWAGTDQVDPSFSGEYADGRHVAFLVASDTGSPVLRQSDGTLIGGATSAIFGPLIEKEFDRVASNLLFRFATQLATSESLIGIDANATTTGWFAGLYNGSVYRANRDFFYLDSKEIGYGLGVAAVQLRDQVKYFEAVAPMLQSLVQGSGYGYGLAAVESDFGTGLRLGGITDAALIEFATDRLHGTERPIQFGTAGDDNLYANSSQSNTFVGGAGNDVLYGGSASDTFEYSLGDGNDTIIEAQDDGNIAPGDRPVDRLLLVGINRAEVGIAVSTSNANDIVLTFTDGATITLAGQLAGNGIEEIVFADGGHATASDLAQVSLGSPPSDNADQIVGTRFDDVLNGLGGDDRIDGGLGNDRISGGTGNDLLIGNAGDDTYVYSAGDGDDTINVYINAAPSLYTNSVADFETLELHGISPDDVTIRKNPLGSGLTYLISGSQKGSINVLGADGDVGIDRVLFDDGTVWNPYDIALRIISAQATNGNDHIIGTPAPWNSDGFYGGQDDIAGGKGDDILEGLSGQDTYRYRLGDGNDTIIDGQDLAGVNKLILEDLLPGDLSFSTIDGANIDLLITINRPEGGSIKLIAADPTRGAVSYAGVLSGGIIFADGSTMSMDDIIKRIAETSATSGDDYLYGSGTGDTINGLAGNDHISSPGPGTIDGGDGDDVIDAWGSQVTGGHGDDDITAASTIIYRAGEGNDVVHIGPDLVLSLVGIDQSDVTYAFADDRHSLLVQIGGAQPGSIKLAYAFTSASTIIAFDDGGSITIPEIAAILAPTTGTSGDDTILGVANHDDTIVGLAGNDDLSGGNGKDKYVYNPGDGHDTIHDDGTDGAEDRLILHGIATTDVTVTRDGDDAILTFNIPEEGSIRLLNQFVGNNIEHVVFDDGSRWSNDELERQTVLFGQDGTLAATNMNDTIYGTVLSETIAGGAGDDVIHSGGGHDVIVFNPGDGHDTVDGLSGLSIIRLGVNPADVAVLENASLEQFGPLNYYLQLSTGDTDDLAQQPRAVH